MTRNRRRKKRSNISEDILNRHKTSVNLNQFSENNDQGQEDNNEDLEDDEDLNFFLPDNLNVSIEQLAVNSPEENQELVEKIYGKEFLDNLKEMTSGNEDKGNYKGDE